MKIGLLIDTMIGGGAERVTLNLFDAFYSIGHDPYIFVLNNKQQHQLIDVPRKKLHFISAEEDIFHIKFINKIALARLLRLSISRIESGQGDEFAFFISSSENMDRISRISMLPNTIIRYRNSMRIYLNNKIGPRNNRKYSYRKLRYTHKFKSIYNSRDIVTVSDALQDDIVEQVKVRPRTIKTIYNPFNFDYIRTSASETVHLPKKPYIIYIARITKRKRQDLLIDAYNTANPSQILILVGDPYDDDDNIYFNEINNKVDNLNLSNRIFFHKFDHNPYPLIKNADLFVMSSDSEGLPTVLIESLIIGTPIVSTNCPTGPAEILTGNLSEFLSPPDDSNALAENISKALSKYPPITDDMIQRFDHKIIARQYIAHANNIFSLNNDEHVTTKDQEFLSQCPGCSHNKIKEISETNELYVCNACSLIFTNPRPTSDFINENYNEGGYYSDFKPDRKWNEMWKRRCDRVLNYIPHGKILDIGAGIGTQAYMLMQHGLSVTTTEISDEAISKASLLYGISHIKGEVGNIPLEDNSFDGITMWHVFEHLLFPGKTLQYLNTKIKKGGHLIIAVPNNSLHRITFKPSLWFSSYAKKLLHLIPPVPYEKTFSEVHLIHFTPYSLRKIVETSGYTVNEISIDNLSLNPSKTKDIKYYFRNLLARKLHYYPHKALFLSATKI